MAHAKASIGTTNYQTANATPIYGEDGDTVTNAVSYMVLGV